MNELTKLIISNVEAPVVILPDGKKEYQDIGTTIEDLRATYPTCYLQEVENVNDFEEETRKIHRSKNYELLPSKVYILHEATSISKDETLLKVFVQLQSDLERLKDKNKNNAKFIEGGSEPSSNSDLAIKSPRSESSSRCNLCHTPFSIFRLKRQCKMCNLEYCTDCCNLKISYPSYFGNFNKPHITCKNCIPIVFKLRHIQTDLLSLDHDIIPSSILKILKKKKKSPRGKPSETPVQSPPEIHIRDNNNNISSNISDPTISGDANGVVVYDRKNELKKDEAKSGWRDLLNSQKDRYKKHKRSKSAGKNIAALVSLVPEIVYSPTAIPSRLENGTFYTAGESSISLLLKFLDPIFRIAYWSSGIKEGAVFDRKLVEAAMKSVPVTATKAKVQFTFPVPEIWPKIDSSEEERNILRENAFKSTGDDPSVSRILTLGFYPKKYKSFSSSKLPAVIWFHGGGFCLGHVHDVLYEGICSFISDTVGCIALAVEYRLAPEYKFPTQVEDCYASLLWIYNHAEELNIDVDKIAIAGDSAGGTIAAVVALMARDRLGPTLARQILIYPCLIDPTNESIESHTRYANGPVLPKKTLSWMLEHLLEDKSYSTHPYVTPLNSEDLSGLPSTTVINALHDPLRDHGDIYARRLRETGVKVTRTVYRRTPHAFFGVNGISESDEALMEVCWSLSEAFNLI